MSELERDNHILKIIALSEVISDKFADWCADGRSADELKMERAIRRLHRAIKDYQEFKTTKQGGK